MEMSLIPCTSDCHYQQDGYCVLERAVTGSLPMSDGKNDCANFVPRAPLGQHGQGLPDGLDPDQR